MTSVSPVELRPPYEDAALVALDRDTLTLLEYDALVEAASRGYVSERHRDRLQELWPVIAAMTRPPDAN